MNIQLKSSLIIIFTMVIGIFLGILIDRTMIRSQFQQKVVRMRAPGRLVMMFERIIEPDESQRETIREILFKYSDRLSEVIAKSRTETETVIDSLQKELAPVLTDEQKDRLTKSIERFKNWKEKGPPFRGPERHPHFEGRKGVEHDF